MKKATLFCVLACIQGIMGCSDPNSNWVGNLDPSAKSQGADSRPEVVINDCQPLDLQSNFLAINSKSAAVGFSVALSAYGRSRDIHIYRLSSGNYAYDLDLDGEVDFQVQPLSSDYKCVNYLDENGKIFGKGCIQISGNRARLRFEPVFSKISNPRRKGETWEDCFEMERSESWVQFVTVMCTVECPEVVLAVYSGIALDCLSCPECDE
ncbi:MAG: hypothetical protein V6Z82_06545 [Flavobacteriales bacterium]